MSGDRYIEIPNWDRFQHYKDRIPLWIKTYVELLADDAYLGLTGHERGVLHGLWLEYASARCQLAVDTASLSRRLGLRVTTATLESLNHAGFITIVASKPLAHRYQAASPEVEVEEKRRFNKTPRSKSNSPEFIIRTMIDNGAISDTIDLEAELRARGINGDIETRLRALLATPPDDHELPPTTDEPYFPTDEYDRLQAHALHANDDSDFEA